MKHVFSPAGSLEVPSPPRYIQSFCSDLHPYKNMFLRWSVCFDWLIDWFNLIYPPFKISIISLRCFFIFKKALIELIDCKMDKSFYFYIWRIDFDCMIDWFTCSLWWYWVDCRLCSCFSATSGPRGAYIRTCTVFSVHLQTCTKLWF